MEITEVESQLKNASDREIKSSKRQLKTLASMLHDDEKILYLTCTSRAWGPVLPYLMMCTNYRVLIMQKGFVYGNDIKQIALDKINTIDYHLSLMYGEFQIIDGAGKETKIDKVPKKEVVKLVKTIQEAMNNYQSKASTSENTNSSNGINDLKQLKQLADEGVITQEEFEAKKKQILRL